uniref:SET domain-containing protein n=1 Tax=Fibrocapsa japonica TaxID=94617 RepID=A0A7S2XZ27_9STRA
MHAHSTLSLLIYSLSYYFVAKYESVAAFSIQSSLGRPYTNRNIDGAILPLHILHREMSRKPRRASALTADYMPSFSENQSTFDDHVSALMGEAITKMEFLQNNSFLKKRLVDSVEVKASSIPGAGLGLFAKKQLKAGTVVSFYPVHVLGMDRDDGSRPIRVMWNSETGQPRKVEDEDQINDKNEGSYLHHLLGSRPLMKTSIADLGHDISLHIDVDTTYPDAPGWVSHRINDGAIVSENSEEGCLKYYQESRDAKNCVHIPFGPCPVLATVATRKVRKGEELFTSYGCMYWLNDGDDGMDITQPVLEEAKAVAQDIFVAMKAAAVTNAKEAEELQVVFTS